jgi:hypothetical protein
MNLVELHSRFPLGSIPKNEGLPPYLKKIATKDNMLNTLTLGRFPQLNSSMSGRILNSRHNAETIDWKMKETRVSNITTLRVP